MLRHLLISSLLLLSACPSASKDTGTWDDDGDGFSESLGDCDDVDPAIHPGASETCDGIDNDCDDEADEDPADAPIWYLDADGDGFGNILATQNACLQPMFYVSDATDCDDLDAMAFPGASETCDGADNDCDGAIDEDAVDARTWYADMDADGYGDSAAPTTACEAPAGSVSDATDCDDASTDVHPGATELCNGIDDDCDSLLDDDDPGIADQLTWYFDADGDGYGLEAVEACIAPAGHVSMGGDCDDDDAAIHPTAPETDCTDPVDYNCDGSTGYADVDADGWAACVDCDDSTSDVNPAAFEICDGIDNDCDGLADEADAVDAATWYIDHDHDGFGSLEYTATACASPAGFVADATDCDDLSSTVHPGAPEICDSLDNDCDPSTEELVPTWYLDHDGDRYGDPNRVLEACDSPVGYVTDSADCDDLAASVNPGSIEVCYNHVDDDCDVDPEDCSLVNASLGDADARFTGEAEDNRAGHAVSGLGDVNGDGFDDVLIAAPNSAAAGTDAGAAYLLLGDTAMADRSLADSSATFTGAAPWAYAGNSISGAGDVNADGLDDILIGASGDGTAGFGAGAAFLVLGRPQPVDLSLADADAIMTGEAAGDTVYPVSGAGDTNGDGYDDILVGARENGAAGLSAGAAYLVLGSESPVSLSLSQADARYTGEAAADWAGIKVSGAGDTDGDGLDDILVSARGHSSADGIEVGAVYLILGSSNPADISLAEADARFTGSATHAWAGITTSGAGDVDGDGLEDVLVGARDNAEGDRGSAYLVLGRSNPVGGSLSGADARFTGETTGDWMVVASSAGDTNGDGFDDIALGADYNDTGGEDAGAAYLVLGGPLVASRSASDADARFAGEAMNDLAGYSVFCAGDMNADGFDDLIIGAMYNSNETGAAYLILGLGE